MTTSMKKRGIGVLPGTLKRAEKEYEGFLKKVEKLPPKEIIEKAYEIVAKEEILIVLRTISETPIDDLDKSLNLSSLNSLALPLATIYRAWLKMDDSLGQTYLDLISKVAEDIFDEKEKERNEKGI